MESDCPVSVSCHREGYSSFELGYVPLGVGALSNIVSCLGSAAIVLAYLMWKDLRKRMAQSIVTQIAMADFCTQVVYLAGTINILADRFPPPGATCSLVFYDTCKIETFIFSWTIMSAYLWTLLLSAYFFMMAVCSKPNLAVSLMPMCHVIAWGVPCCLSFAFLCFDKLEYLPFVTGVWCSYYVPRLFFNPPFVGFGTLERMLLKAPEIVGLLLVLILYITTLVVVRRKVRQIQGPLIHKSGVSQVLVSIPLVYFLTRVWCTAMFFYSSHVAREASKPDNNYCISNSLKYGYVALCTTQAIMAGATGWVNAILYIALSRRMRQKILNSVKKITGRSSSTSQTAQAKHCIQAELPSTAGHSATQGYLSTMHLDS